MMKAAFAYWDDRIAPVFDAARRIHVVEADSGRIVAETGEVLADVLPAQKALRLVELGVGTLVCGAISRSYHETVAAYGIRVIPFVAGDLSEVIQAWLSGNLESDTFVMAGCSGRGRGRRRGMRSTGKEDMAMPRGDGTGPMGMGARTGRAAGYCAGSEMPGYAHPVPGRGSCNSILLKSHRREDASLVHLLHPFRRVSRWQHLSSVDVPAVTRSSRNWKWIRSLRVNSS
jgi:predicted Fe-Mo cluster-binding NifX family protein